VQFRYVVTNTGEVHLSALTLTDNVFEAELEGILDTQPLPDDLAPGASFTRILTGIDAEAGQHKNTVTASGEYNNLPYQETDDAHYFGKVCLVPEIKVDLDPLVIDLREVLEVKWTVTNPAGEEITEQVEAFITLYNHLGSVIKEDQFSVDVTVGAGQTKEFETTTYDTSPGEEWETACGSRFEFRLESACDDVYDTLEVIVRCMETAYAGDERGIFPPGGWWFYYDTNVGGSQTIRAGQFFNAGTVEAVLENNQWTITINLDWDDQDGLGWRLKRAVENGAPTEDPVEEAVKLQGYKEGELPDSRPPSGPFTTYKGEELVVEFTDNDYKYFVIHLDVEYIGVPEDRVVAD